jgi:Skp family chaperone for outer membrane proteins
MKPKFICSISAAIVLFSVAAFSQAGSNPSTALPPAPGAAADSPAPMVPSPNATKLAAINIEQAIFASNEGQRDMGALQKKFEPKTNDLKAKNDEIEALKKQMTATSVTETRKGEISRDIELKQKAFDRARQDAQEDFQSQQSEIGQRIFQKMGPVIMKYAQENGLGLILDTSTPWPNGPVLWANPASIDITKNIVDAYNAQSGVPAPAAGTATRPAPATRSTTPAAKPPTTTAPPK